MSRQSETVAEYLADAEKFLKTGTNGQNRPKIFTPEILYNVLAMSIEKYFMAALAAEGDIPDNHTFTDFIEAAERNTPLPARLADELHSFESYQEICAVYEGYVRKELTPEVIVAMTATANRIRDWAAPILAA